VLPTFAQRPDHRFDPCPGQLLQRGDPLIAVDHQVDDQAARRNHDDRRLLTVWPPTTPATAAVGPAGARERSPGAAQVDGISSRMPASPDNSTLHPGGIWDCRRMGQCHRICFGITRICLQLDCAECSSSVPIMPNEISPLHPELGFARYPRELIQREGNRRRSGGLSPALAGSGYGRPKSNPDSALASAQACFFRRRKTWQAGLLQARCRASNSIVGRNQPMADATGVLRQQAMIEPSLPKPCDEYSVATLGYTPGGSLSGKQTRVNSRKRRKLKSLSLYEKTPYWMSKNQGNLQRKQMKWH